jgi:hypothetical protein
VLVEVLLEVLGVFIVYGDPGRAGRRWQLLPRSTAAFPRLFSPAP